MALRCSWRIFPNARTASSFFGGRPRNYSGVVPAARPAPCCRWPIDKHCYIGTGFLPPFFGIRPSHHMVPYRGGRKRFPRSCTPLFGLGCRRSDFDDTQGIELFHQGRSAGALRHRLELGLRRRPDQRLERNARQEPRRLTALAKARDGPRAEQAQGKRRMPGTRSPAPMAASSFEPDDFVLGHPRSASAIARPRRPRRTG